MVGVIITFQFGDGFDREAVVGVAERSAPMFQGVPGLRFKLFTVDEDGRRAVNVYLWDSDEAARGFFTPELLDRATESYGVAPASVEFLDVAVTVDNNSPAAV